MMGKIAAPITLRYVCGKWFRILQPIKIWFKAISGQMVHSYSLVRRHLSTFRVESIEQLYSKGVMTRNMWFEKFLNSGSRNLSLLVSCTALIRSASVQWGLNDYQKVRGSSPGTVGPLRKVFNPLRSRGAVSWLNSGMFFFVVAWIRLSHRCCRVGVML